MKNFYFLTLFFLASTFTRAQIIAHVGDKINDNVTVTAVDETETHYWVGTDKGLYRINKGGKNYVLYTKRNSPLQSDKVTSICCRKDGDVWIGTNNGMLQYDGYSFNIIDTDNSKLPENHITSMKEDANGDLWIGTLKSGLVKVHRGRFYIYNEENSNLADNSIHSIIASTQNNLVISSAQNQTVNLSSIVKK